MKQIHIDASQLGSALEDHFKHLLGDLNEAAIDVAHRGREHFRRLAISENIPDKGVYHNAVRVEQTPTGPAVVNNAPHAVYVEFGRRAMAAPPPIKPIAEWAERKLGVPMRTGPNGRVYSKAAWAIRKKIHEDGIPPKFIMLRTYRAMKGWWSAEIRKVLATSTP